MQQIDIFLRECSKCFDCFKEYCFDNTNEDGYIEPKYVAIALEQFVNDIDIGYRLSKEAYEEKTVTGFIDDIA